MHVVIGIQYNYKEIYIILKSEYLHLSVVPRVNNIRSFILLTLILLTLVVRYLNNKKYMIIVLHSIWQTNVVFINLNDDTILHSDIPLYLDKITYTSNMFE